LRAISISEILRIGERAQEMRRSGRDVIILGAGEPDFDTPIHVKEAACKAIHDGKTKYTALEGTPELRSAICDDIKLVSNVEYSRSEVIVSSGAKQVIFNALAATLERGDEVILPTPYWTSYEDMVVINGGVPTLVPCGDDKDFKVDPDSLERAITPRTRWIILNSPSNPTGAAYHRRELQALLDVIEPHPQVMVLSDEIYQHIVYDGFDHVSAAELSPQLRDRILVVNGVSKTYAMTGWRIGWGAGPRGMIEAMAAVQSQVTSCASSVGQAAALAALVGPQDDVYSRVEAFRLRRDMLVKELNSMPGITCRVPDGAFYVFPNCRGLMNTVTPSGKRLLEDRHVTDYFLEEANVAVVPGSSFGMPGYFRISYAASLDSLREACKRLSGAVHALRQNSSSAG
jgi:aspartate aminotransferase